MNAGLARTWMRALVTLAAVLVPVQAGALNFVAHQEPDGRTALTATGLILPGDSRRLMQFVNTMNKVAHLAGLTVNSPGGFVLEAEGMAQTIHNVHVAVTVAGTCASACVLLFAAAPRRAAVEGARIGVHRAQIRGQESDNTLLVTSSMAMHFDLYDVPPGITAKMRATPPGQITWLTPDDLAAMHVTILPRIPLP